MIRPLKVTGYLSRYSGFTGYERKEIIKDIIVSLQEDLYFR